MNPWELLEHKIDVLRDLDPLVEQLIAEHKAKQSLWYSSDFLPGSSHEDIPEKDAQVRSLRDRAKGIPDAARIALTLNLLTEEGLPHFHRIIADHLKGKGEHWNAWNNLWTAEEDRHGNVLRDYMRDSRLVNFREVEALQARYLEKGFSPDWSADPYELFLYTTLQERATAVAHLNTGKYVRDHEPLILGITGNIAADESRHYAFYFKVFAELLKADPNHAMASAAKMLPSIDMPGISIDSFTQYADVIRRAGIYGPRHYQDIVEKVIAGWKLEECAGLDAQGRQAQERACGIPRRLEKVIDRMERGMQQKSYSFPVIYGRFIDGLNEKPIGISFFVPPVSSD